MNSFLTNYLLRYGNRLNEFEKACDSRDEWKILNLISYTNKEIYYTTVKMISAVAKRIRKHILYNHLNCIHRAQRRSHKGPICPYAFAYLHWRKSIEYRQSISQVDGMPINRINLTFFYPTFASIEHRHLLSQGLYRWSGEGELRKYESMAATKWITNRVLGLLLFEHFYDWLSYALEIDPTIREVETLPSKYLRDPHFLIKVPRPDERSSNFEFHWWTKTVRKKELIGTCPYVK